MESSTALLPTSRISASATTDCPTDGKIDGKHERPMMAKMKAVAIAKI